MFSNINSQILMVTYSYNKWTRIEKSCKQLIMDQLSADCNMRNYSG